MASHLPLASRTPISHILYSKLSTVINSLIDFPSHVLLSANSLNEKMEDLLRAPCNNVCSGGC